MDDSQDHKDTIYRFYAIMGVITVLLLTFVPEFH